MRENRLRVVLFTLGTLVGFFVAHIYATKSNEPRLEVNNIDRHVDSLPAVVEPPDTRLPPPTFMHPGVLTSDLNGSIYLAWSKIPGAKEYQVTVVDREGKPAKSFKVSRNITSVTGLYVNPKASQTPYKAVVAAIDESGSIGHESEKKDLAMLPMRNLAPPSIKSIRTE